MKNIIFTVFFALILAGFTAFGQTNQLIKQVNTLQNGSVMITLMLQDSTYLKQYFALSTVDTSLLFNNILTSLPQSDQSNPDYQIENDDLFGENTSALPWDICFNPAQNKYYIYNYRKIMIRNNNGAGYFDTPVNISNFDEINENLLETIPSKKILYYNNYLYCTSNEGKLVIINCINNQIITEFPAYQMSSVYKSDLRLVGSDVYWFYCAIDDSGLSGATFIKKISGVSLSASLNLTGIIVNDWCFDEYNNMYIATNDGLFKYSSDFALINSNLQYQNMANIEYFNNGTTKRIVARSYHPGNYQMLAFTTNLFLNQIFNTTCDMFFEMKFSPANNSIHYTGVRNNHACNYGKIRFNSSTNEFYEDALTIKNFDVPIALEINSTDAYVGDKGKIHKIEENNNQTDYNIDGYCTSLSNGNYASTSLLGTMSLAGDFFVFGENMQFTAYETGGIVRGVCNKLDCSYYAISKNNGNGYILCKNKNSITHISPEIDYFDPKAIFCFDEDEQTNIIVIYEGINENEESTLKFAKIYYTTNEISVLENLEYLYSRDVKDYLIKRYDKKIFITGFMPNSCGNVPFVCFKYSNPAILEYRNTSIQNCPDFEFKQSTNQLFALNRCHFKIASYNPDNLSMISEAQLDYNNVPYTPISLIINSETGTILICAYDHNNDSDIKLLKYSISSNIVIGSYDLNSVGEKVIDLSLNPNNNAIYGFSNKYWYFKTQNSNPVQYDFPTELFSFDVHFDSQKNVFYLPSFNNADNTASTFILDATINQFVTPIVSDCHYIINSVEEQNLSDYSSAIAIISASNHGMVSCSKITCPFTRPLHTPWHWLSFPRLQRIGNNPVPGIPVLENTEPMPYNLSFYSNEAGQLKYIARANNFWTIVQFENILSTKGYKLNIQDQGAFTHTMYGSDVNPNTPVPLYGSQNGNPENWIGYFLHQPLMPQVALQGVWDNLTLIKTQDWTMTKVILNGKPVWISPSNVGPLKYGDGLIVKVAANCTLYWNEMGEPATDSERLQTEFFSYDEYADYTPWYIETDSLTDVKEIGLMAGEICVGASSVEPGDTLIEVNAYTQSIPPGTPIEIATWSGLKSTAQLQDRFFVTSPKSALKECRKVYSGEGLPYYYISFGGGQIANPSIAEGPAGITSISPNPCRDFVTIRFRVATDAHVEIAISGLNGEVIGTIANGDYHEGVYEVIWNPGNIMGKPVQNGIYLIRLSVNGLIISNEKVVLIK